MWKLCSSTRARRNKPFCAFCSGPALQGFFLPGSGIPALGLRGRCGAEVVTAAFRTEAGVHGDVIEAVKVFALYGAYGAVFAVDGAVFEK